MLEIIIIVAIAYALALFFIPLGKIAKAQDWVKAKVKQAKNKLEN